MTKQELINWITELTDKDEIWKFYKCREWVELKNKVLQECHYECQMCRSKGKIKKAQTVHHLHYVKDYPQYALSQYILDEDNKRVNNLMALCNSCHNHVHYDDKIGKKNNANKEDISPERWD